ncbi:hypothetical protein OIU84_027081 [Salix udensis]|uniref:ATP synthase delta chain n=1 Tax=Salix udensis TaxID=889485 RepID=A0AAD6PB48_9ROSI|nr:hypothetical protein OIU84_027081 [Salix udensis]
MFSTCHLHYPQSHNKWLSSYFLPDKITPPSTTPHSRIPTVHSSQNPPLHHSRLSKTLSPIKRRKQVSATPHLSPLSLATWLQHSKTPPLHSNPKSHHQQGPRPTSPPQNPSTSPSPPLSHRSTSPPPQPLQTAAGGGSALGTKMSATAAGSYASALADLAKSNNTLDATASDVDKIERLFLNPAASDFFANPTIDLEKKRLVVDEFAKESALQPLTANFINILIDAKRVDLIKDIVVEFEKAYNKMTDTQLAVVSSVVALESQHLAQIAKQVQKMTGAKNVRIKTVIDPSLVAGFTVRYGNSGSKLIDMSVKKQLEEITAQLDLSDIELAV